jgi:hypothetical protein
MRLTQVTLLASALGALALAAPAQAQIALLSPAPAAASSSTAQGLVAAASTPTAFGHPVTLAEAAFAAETGEALTLTLPGRAAEDFVLTDVRREGFGTTLVAAPSATPGANRVLIVRSGSYAFGRIERDGQVWLLEPAAGGGLALIAAEAFGKELGFEDDQILAPTEVQSLALERAAPSFSPLGPQRPTNTDPVVDIALFYTPGIVEAHGLGTQARMGFLFELLRQGLRDSNTGVTAELVHLGPVNYSDTNSLSTALTDLRTANNTADGDLSLTTEIAAAKGADLIHLMRRFRSSVGSCGLAYLINGNVGAYSPNLSFAYGASSDGSENGSGCSTYTFAHEIGHNMGLGHDNKNTSSPCDSNTPKDGRGNGVMPYSCGFNANGIVGATAYRTIMAYNIGGETRQGIFSNPQLNVCGNGTEICGAVETDPNPADAARSHREQGWKASNGRGRATQLVSAVLPSSRSIGSTGTASVFATMINPGTNAAANCRPVINGLPSARLSYQTTNALNALTGTANTPVNVAAGAAQSFVVGVAAAGTQSPIDLFIDFQCDNRRQAGIIAGVNTLTFASSATGTLDVLAIGSTLSGDGVVRIPGSSGAQAFALAAVNISATGGTMRVQPTVTGAGSTLTVTVCDTTGSATGTCAAPPAASVTVSGNTNEVRTFSLFATATAPIAFDAAVNRIRVSLRDAGGVERGATSVAVTTQ